MVTDERIEELVEAGVHASQGRFDNYDRMRDVVRSIVQELGLSDDQQPEEGAARAAGEPAPVGRRPLLEVDMAAEVIEDDPNPRTRPQMESAWQTLTTMIDRSVQQHGEDGHFAQTALVEARRQVELEISTRFGQEHVEALRTPVE